jgi:hypothetical protein
VPRESLSQVAARNGGRPPSEARRRSRGRAGSGPRLRPAPRRRGRPCLRTREGALSFELAPLGFVAPTGILRVSKAGGRGDGRRPPSKHADALREHGIEDAQRERERELLPEERHHLGVRGPSPRTVKCSERYGLYVRSAGDACHKRVRRVSEAYQKRAIYRSVAEAPRTQCVAYMDVSTPSATKCWCTSGRCSLPRPRSRHRAGYLVQGLCMPARPLRAIANLTRASSVCRNRGISPSFSS